ncbi:putative gtp-binding protein alpha subunit gna [Fasciola gigantica]|uniref:Putative gtp-binding protein alpha subunit gna n=1 Tax=Fasciola gigantica TaxID=46835 RepID=A0A504YW39_FASGI|nr:putative gtp-binding protein alpha subunit gna [Fasciola gigantica]
MSLSVRNKKTDRGLPVHLWNFLQARENLCFPLALRCDHSEAAQAAQQLEAYFRDTRVMRRDRARLNQLQWTEDEFLQLVPAMRAIWADPSIQSAFDQRAKVITENFVSALWSVRFGSSVPLGFNPISVVLLAFLKRALGVGVVFVHAMYPLPYLLEGSGSLSLK